MAYFAQLVTLQKKAVVVPVSKLMETHSMVSADLQSVAKKEILHIVESVPIFHVNY